MSLPEKKLFLPITEFQKVFLYVFLCTEKHSHNKLHYILLLLFCIIVWVFLPSIHVKIIFNIKKNAILFFPHHRCPSIFKFKERSSRLSLFRFANKKNDRSKNEKSSPAHRSRRDRIKKKRKKKKSAHEDYKQNLFLRSICKCECPFLSC